MFYFKFLVSIVFIRTEDMTNAIWLSNKATWYESFGEAKRVYDGHHPYLGLLINTETEDPVICDPLWLSENARSRIYQQVNPNFWNSY